MCGCFLASPRVVPTPDMQADATRESDSSLLIQQTANPSTGRQRVGPSAAYRDFEPLVPPRDWTSMVLHHTGTQQGDVTSIDQAHLQRTDDEGRPWLGIGYHFLIGNGRGMDDGQIEPTFRWRRQLQGAHAGVTNYNEQGIGICLVGDFESEPPTERQVEAVESLIGTLSERFGISATNMVRHSDISDTLCPGRMFPFDEITARVLSRTDDRLTERATQYSTDSSRSSK